MTWIYICPDRHIQYQEGKCKVCGKKTVVLEEKMYEKFWTCLVEGTDGGTHHRHANTSDARVEAERLARQPQNRGRKVFIMESVAYYRAPEAPIEWHNL